MAKQVAARSIVTSFGKLSFDQQKEALARLNEQHEQSRAAKIMELKGQLAELGYRTPRELVRSKPVKKAERAKRKGGARKRRGNGAVKAKYRDAKTGDTWSGRGRMASWLKAKQDAGESIDRYLIS